MVNDWSADERSQGRLGGSARALFDRWHSDALERHRSTLQFREVRKGVQALSSLYVERRAGADLAARATAGRGKRAALATYYAALHFLTVRCALGQLGPTALIGVRRVIDLGCGTGAAGAAVATTHSEPPELLGIDRSGWAVRETRHTYAAFMLRGRALRGRLPEAFPPLRRGDLCLLAFALNEFSEPAREALLQLLVKAQEGGASLLLLEPLAGAAAPWWGEAAHTLTRNGGRMELVKQEVERPPWIAELDRASGLDHRVLGARMLFTSSSELETDVSRGTTPG